MTTSCVRVILDARVSDFGTLVYWPDDIAEKFERERVVGTLKLHDLGIHRFCLVVQEPVLGGIDYSREFIPTSISDLIEVTTFGGIPIYKRDDRGEIVHEEVHYC